MIQFITPPIDPVAPKIKIFKGSGIPGSLLTVIVAGRGEHPNWSSITSCLLYLLSLYCPSISWKMDHFNLQFTLDTTVNFISTTEIIHLLLYQNLTPPNSRIEKIIKKNIWKSSKIGDCRFWGGSKPFVFWGVHSLMIPLKLPTYNQLVLDSAAMEGFLFERDWKRSCKSALQHPYIKK